MGKPTFETRNSFLSVSKKTESGVATIGGKHIELVDTPGLLDPCSVEHDSERLDFARGLISMTSGFHMLALVFNITKRVERGEDKIFNNLLCTYKHYLPYVVLIFTHGKHLGGTEDEQRSIVAGMIKEVNEKQKNSNLNQLLKKINYRYIILESVKPMEKGYHAKKSKELVKMINTIFKQTGKPATNEFALSIAENLKRAKVDQRKVEKELADRIKTAQEMAKKDESGGSNFYTYLGYSILIGGGILATVMSGVVPAALTAAAAAAKATGSMGPWLLAVAGNAALEKAKTCTFQ